MSRKRKSAIIVFLVSVTLYVSTVQVTHSVSLRHKEDDLRTYQRKEPTVHWWEKIESHPDFEQRDLRWVEHVIKTPELRQANQPDIDELRPELAALAGGPVPKYRVNKPDGGFAPNGSFWTVGEIRPLSWSSSSSSRDGYQADSTGSDGVMGKVMGPSFDASPLFKTWQSMRPLVHCDNNVMTFTASGEGLPHLLVDRGAASPISPFHLPPYCGYSVRTTWSDFEMMVPYDACYITQENGSYVLPLMWQGSPLKLSCPVQVSSPAPSSSHSAPSVFCSPYGIGVQIPWQEQDIPMMGVIVNGALSPFVSPDCAYPIHSYPGQLAFFISSTALCITTGDGLQLHLILDDKGYILSCPVYPQSPYVPSPPSSPPLAPGEPQSPFLPGPASPPPTSPPPPPPQPPTREQIAQRPEHPYNPYPGFHYHQLPQVYPPGQQPARRPQPTPYSPPGSQPKLSIRPSEPGKPPFSPRGFLNSPPHSHQTTEIPDISHDQYQSGGYYPFAPFYYPAVTPAPTPTTKKTDKVPPSTQPPQPPAHPYYPLYYNQIPYYPEPAAQAPASLQPSPRSYPPPSPSKQTPEPSQALVDPFYPPASYSSYYHYLQWYHMKPDLDQVSTSPLSSPSTVTTKVSKQPHPQISESLSPTCPPFSHTICSYYPYPYYPFYHLLYPPYYHPFYPPVPQYPQIPPPKTTSTPTTTTASTTTTSTTLSPPKPTPQTPHLQCLVGRMVVFLPFAHPDSIQVRDQKKSWLFLSSVPPRCGYALQGAEGPGVFLHSPLPACHSQQRSPTTISIPLRFWDLSLGQYRTLDLQCPYKTAPKTPAVTSPTPPPTLPDHTKSKPRPSVVPKPEVFCYSHQMNVELPPGPISEIVVKDNKGNQMNLQDVPKHCGYSAKKGKDGKVRLSLQLHSRCHMSVQGKMFVITVYYMTVNGRQEAQFSCPVIIRTSGQECNLPSEQRLPCGHGSVSQPQCLSMGCCFNKQPPACFYPMDECTIDRHFVFSVPASLTEPPLSPALLVAAGNSTCKPQRVNSDYALFKIPMDGCGTRRVMVGKTMIYMVEVINKVQTISLNYGTITRDSPVRLLVECRFVPNTLLSVSYMVKTPTLGPEVQTQGMFGVQLRIAKDATYSSYHPQYHQPLQMLLGKPLYLEVRLLNSPDPNLVLLVHFCVAYPRSGKAVWLLLYNGCPNPLDPASQQAVLFDPPPPSPRAQTRRFTISTFQFLPDGEFKDSDEEIYFMCSTEICSPRDGPCVEGCFGQ